MIEPSVKLRSRNKTIRRKINIENKQNTLPLNKEVENILYVKDIITPSSMSVSMSTPSYNTPDSENKI